MSNTFRFEEEVLNTVISNHLKNKLNYKRFTEGELRLTIKDKYSPPYQRIRIDFFGESKDKSHYFLLELKQQSDPPNIMMALGEALMYRQMIKDEPNKMLIKCKSFDAEKPIHLGLCFPDFNKLRCKNRREFKYRSWTDDTSIFLNKILKSFIEPQPVQVFLIRCKETNKIKSHKCFKDTENRDLLYVDPLGDSSN